ncbi:MAG: hypothetical protein U0869_07995 [Chloroflexota bacterium]
MTGPGTYPNPFGGPTAQETWDRVTLWFVISIQVAIWATVLALFLMLGWMKLGPGHELRDAAAAVEDRASTLVQSVDVVHGRLIVTLVATASDADARETWCSIVLRTAIPVSSEAIHADGPPRTWDPPAHCDDPTDIPAARPRAS